VYTRTVTNAKALTPAQALWQATPDEPHVSFHLFHMFRFYDRGFHRMLSPQGELWERNKWGMHFKLPQPPPNVSAIWSTGNSWTPQEVAAWTPPPLDQLLAYGDSVMQSGMRKLATADLSDLNRQITYAGGTTTLLVALRGLCSHATQHAGQVDYLIGLMRSLGVK
jgi:hypothetical protein